MPKREREDPIKAANRENIIYGKLNLQGWCLKLSKVFELIDRLEAGMDDIKSQYDSYRTQKEECKRLLKADPKDKQAEKELKRAEKNIQELTERMFEYERRSTKAERELDEIKGVIREKFGVDPYRGIGV
jgi:predicted  nucleic acid-binding Zn-ribbon protein